MCDDEEDDGDVDDDSKKKIANTYTALWYTNTILSSCNIVFHLILITILWDMYHYYLHFLMEKPRHRDSEQHILSSQQY